MSMATLEIDWPSTAAWPPPALRGQIVLRHWRGAPFILGTRTTLLVAGDLDPGFVSPSPAVGACLDAWRTSKTPAATHSHVSLVDITTGGYVGIRDTVDLELSSSSKIGIMYPVVQLIHDLAVVEERVHPANDAELYLAMRQQWAQDLVDAGRFGSVASARAWITANGPKLERCATLAPVTTIHTDLNDALRGMVINSINSDRLLCIKLVGEWYINSVLSQSGELRAMRPVAWRSTMRAQAALITLVANQKLVSPDHSLWMQDLLRESVAAHSTWARDALMGNDGAGETRAFDDVAGKVGFLYGGPEETWYDNVTVMDDVSLVTKPGDKRYVLSFAIPFFQHVIQKSELFPLIRAAHDCVP
jgi:hypothetical protein